MTLKFRNRFFVVLVTFFSVTCVFLFTFFFVALGKAGISFPDFFRFPSWFSKIPFLPFNSIALFLSIFSLAVYAIVCSIVIVFNFEKTNSVEIVLFAGFLICCCLEGFRLIPPAFGIWRPLDGPVFLCTRMVLAGRLFAPVTFVCAAIMKDESLTQDIGVKFLLAALGSTVVAFLVPIDSTKFTSTMLCFWGFANTLFIIRFLIFLSAIVSFIIETKKNGEEGLYKLPLWFTLLFTGYAILSACDTLVFFFLGLFLLAFGTFKYLMAIHQNYLWR